MLRTALQLLSTPPSQTSTPHEALAVRARPNASDFALVQAIRDAHASMAHALHAGAKDDLRAFHIAAKMASQAGPDQRRVTQLFERQKSWFRAGKDIDVARIKPRLVLVNDKQSEELWTLARACWSMPPNKGYGRRLRFLIIDEAHGALMGILGLQSPPADLGARDELFSYPEGRKLELVNQTMDAYTVGAIPPYSFLVAGKLCAGMICANEIREAYWAQYAGSRSLMERKLLRQPLVAVSTTSAFGRSSIYNRLTYESRKLASCIGSTRGYGLLHLEGLYPQIQSALARWGNLTPAGFGNGPKVRWQNVTRFLQGVGAPTALLCHGLERPVYWFPLVDDLEGGMRGDAFGMPLPMTQDDFANYWLQRWALPRAARFPHWDEFDSRALILAKIVAEARPWPKSPERLTAPSRRS